MIHQHGTRSSLISHRSLLAISSSSPEQFPSDILAWLFNRNSFQHIGMIVIIYARVQNSKNVSHLSLDAGWKCWQSNHGEDEVGGSSRGGSSRPLVQHPRAHVMEMTKQKIPSSTIRLTQCQPFPAWKFYGNSIYKCWFIAGYNWKCEWLMEWGWCKMFI